MDLGDGADAGYGILESLPAPRVLKLAALKVQQAGDQLERVLDPVVDLLQQHVLLGEQRLLLVEHAAHALLAAPQIRLRLLFPVHVIKDDDAADDGPGRIDDRSAADP